MGRRSIKDTTIELDELAQLQNKNDVLKDEAKKAKEEQLDARRDLKTANNMIGDLIDVTDESSKETAALLQGKDQKIEELE